MHETRKFKTDTIIQSIGVGYQMEEYDQEGYFSILNNYFLESSEKFR